MGLRGGEGAGGGEEMIDCNVREWGVNVSNSTATRPPRPQKNFQRTCNNAPLIADAVSTSASPSSATAASTGR